MESVPPPSDIEVVETDDGWFEASSVIAGTDDGLWLVSAVALLVPFEEDGVSKHELQFGVGVTDVEGDTATIHMDREGARPYVDDDLRPWVMPCVCELVRSLVEKVQPRSIYRVTKVTQRHPDGMKKHELVTGILLEMGYKLTDTGTTSWGGVFWALSS